MSLSHSGAVNSTVVNLMPKVMFYFLEVEIPDEVMEHAFCDLMIGGVCAWQVVCISWSWWLLFFAVWRNTVIVVRVHSKIIRRFRNGKSIAMRHRPNCWWYIRINKCWLFLHGHTILNTGHHTQITVSTVIARHPPNKGHSKQHTMSFSIHPCIEFGWAHSAAHVCCQFLSWSPTLQPKYKKYAFFIVGVNKHFLETNVTFPQT